jgi:hypothetical protein
LVRVEVRSRKTDAGLIRASAERLRARPDKARALRSTLADAESITKRAYNRNMIASMRRFDAGVRGAKIRRQIRAPFNAAPPQFNGLRMLYGPDGRG